MVLLQKSTQNKGVLIIMEKHYEKPEITITFFEIADAITLSGDVPIELPDITFLNNENWY